MLGYETNCGQFYECTYVVVCWTILGCTRIPKILSIRITAGYEDIYGDKYNIGQSQDLPGFLLGFIFRSFC